MCKAKFVGRGAILIDKDLMSLFQTFTHKKSGHCQGTPLFLSTLPSDSSPWSNTFDPQARRMLSKHSALSHSPLAATPNVATARWTAAPIGTTAAAATGISISYQHCRTNRFVYVACCVHPYIPEADHRAGVPPGLAAGPPRRSWPARAGGAALHARA